VAIPPKGQLLLFTDGITEASDRNGQVFGSDRLHDALRASAGASAQGICSAAYDAVCAYCGDLTPQDDVLLVAIQAQ
jgi:serine phosphatase RsbU (regulator of sigma subunit)